MLRYAQVEMIQIWIGGETLNKKPDRDDLTIEIMYLLALRTCSYQLRATAIMEGTVRQSAQIRPD